MISGACVVVLSNDECVSLHQGEPLQGVHRGQPVIGVVLSHMGDALRGTRAGELAGGWTGFGGIDITIEYITRAPVLGDVPRTVHTDYACMLGIRGTTPQTHTRCHQPANAVCAPPKDLMVKSGVPSGGTLVRIDKSNPERL